MIATQHAMGNSLRWMRRLIVVTLIVANLMAILLAEAASATRSSQFYVANAWDRQASSVSVSYSSSSVAGGEGGTNLLR